MSDWRPYRKTQSASTITMGLFHWVIYRIQLFLFSCWWSFEDTALTQTHNLIIYNLSPLLSILYTNSCTGSYPGRNLIKFTDDTALVSLLQGNKQQLGPVLDECIEGCNESHFLRNTLKTKAMSIDFRKEPAWQPSEGSPYSLSPCVWDQCAELIQTKGGNRDFILWKSQFHFRH